MRGFSPSTTGLIGLHHAGLGSRLAALAGANAASVAALYLGQALTKAIARDFPAGAVPISLIPGATLAGYAIGVSAIAFSPAAKIMLSVHAHLGLLAMALCGAGMAPTATALAVASVAVGVGASVAQRLLAAAGNLGGTARSGMFIGKTICAALTAVLGIRLAGDISAQLVGWRPTFYLVGAAAALFGLLNWHLQASGTSPCPTTPTKNSGMIGLLWRRSPLLRWAVFQHGAMFATYNLAWMTILLEIPAQERAAVVIGGGGTGIIMALLAGYCVDRFPRRDLARYGVAAVALATSLLLPVAYISAPGLQRALLLLPGMALLDGGLQVALVANQARVQTLLPNARPRLAALLTVCGSLGGATGAGLGYWLWQRFGWQASISLAALSGLLGFGCAAIAGAKRPNHRAALAYQDHPHAMPPCRMPSLLEDLRRPAPPMPVREQTRTA